MHEAPRCGAERRSESPATAARHCIVIVNHCIHCFLVWAPASEALDSPFDFAIFGNSFRTQLQYKPLTESQI
jgi:hypothetical protein